MKKEKNCQYIMMNYMIKDETNDKINLKFEECSDGYYAFTIKKNQK